MPTLTRPRPKPKLLTTVQAAKALKLSRCRVMQFCREGRIGQQIGRYWLISTKELQAFRAVKRPPGRPKEKKSNVS